MMRRILITGANGFVGQMLCRKLQHAGHHIVALVSPDSPRSAYAAESLHCDIRDAAGLEQVVSQANPTHVVHLAAITHVPTSFQDPLATWQTNVMGSVNLLQALQRKAPQAFVLFVSSSEVYGEAFKQGIALDENSVCKPMNPYAASKLAAEAAFHEYFRRGQNGIVVRPFNHIGARQSADFATASFARQIALIEAGKQAPQLKVGNLQAARDFLDVRDVCNAYVALLDMATRQEAYPQCLNICSGEPVRIEAILSQLMALSSERIDVINDPERMRLSDIPCAFGDNSAIQKVTGWTPTTTLQSTLTTLLNYWRDEIAATA
ncbi:GDP-mannose 4,6-dehydratase [Pseudomonas savastanoi]|uniref:GDP-mannose 4,6-dehydratase n=7 Tax=Pseudomonas syringae group TaxID=136849 RepID=A0A3M6AVL4_PSESS|nr:NAD-dependent epimerase/dehydratase [Pseudomonas savastanoi]KPB63026.1 GDP-mannose 4,6-dehydratase [Pseudomonas amygdali pv. myricae]KPC56934.1 GDP-mannose 4,6-dehydratase [Pseudomonas amygdali pv. morsprunorum]KPW76213.1 GDP-mannose 4,6-dehydratase [Pseudomonas amygdali pv. ciccaronei]KPX00436.1 GDP-mannose 4,6-dehydratase [Pseudomonas syringae pv. castaneae]KPX05273.1 GDP-mannose 4,6-dehydratase [Pseudomonas syringae pv. cunninghamiae]KPX11378.1 GDP-mannose 4,6-dehydratase [Pseudomonas s